MTTGGGLLLGVPVPPPRRDPASGAVVDGVVSSLCEAANAAPETERSKMAVNAARMAIPGSTTP